MYPMERKDPKRQTGMA